MKIGNRKWMLMDAAADGGQGGGAGSGGTALTSGGGAGGAAGGAAAGGAAGDTGKAGAATGTAGDTGAAAGAAASDWRSTLPPELRENAVLGKYKSQAELANAYLNAQKHISAEKVAIPNKNWTDKEWSEFNKKIGLPEAPDKYEVDFGKDAAFPPELQAGFKAIAHKAGILPKAAQELVKWFGEHDAKATAAALEAEKVAVKAGLEALNKEWGQASKLQWGRATKVLKELGSKELENALNTSGAGNSPEVIKFFAKVGEVLWKEDAEVAGATGTSGALTPSEAKAERVKIMGDTTHPYWNKDHPGHKDAVKRVAELFASENHKVG